MQHVPNSHFTQKHEKWFHTSKMIFFSCVHSKQTIYTFLLGKYNGTSSVSLIYINNNLTSTFIILKKDEVMGCSFMSSLIIQKWIRKWDG